MTKEEILSQPKHLCRRCNEYVLEQMFVLEESVCGMCYIQIEHFAPKESRCYYVYEHYNDDGIFYVGKGSGNRAWEGRRNNTWKKVADKGYKVNIVQENMYEMDAFALEKQLIEHYDNLTNRRDYIY